LQDFAHFRADKENGNSVAHHFERPIPAFDNEN
jgi:hypothetical protein